MAQTILLRQMFPLDGTLYQLDGVRNGYQGSTLERCVLDNAKKFIITRERCSEVEALSILEQGLTDKTGVSSYLANRYGMSRRDYFDEVWNIDPKGIVRNFQSAQQMVRMAKEAIPDEKTILLTSAPRIWAERVLDYLEITDVFEQVFTAEEYGSKEEVFAIMAGRYEPSNIVSIGDQESTDILPAKKYGINGFLVTSPSDFDELVTIRKGENTK
jgi:FMN phosphatase YigB (HAD superfamily)